MEEMFLVIVNAWEEQELYNLPGTLYKHGMYNGMTLMETLCPCPENPIET